MKMELGALKKITAPSVDPLIKPAGLSDEAKALVTPGMAVRALLSALIEADLMTDALRIFAYAMPRREAVWWSCQCARQALPEQPEPIDLEIIKASEAWVYRPNDNARRAVMDLAMETEFDRAAHWTAAATFWSGGSIAPPDSPAVEPDESLTGNAVVGAFLLAAVQPEADDADRKRELFLAQAIDIADGGDGRKVVAR